MRNKSIILLLSMAIVYAMASINMPLPKGKRTKKATGNAVIVDSLLQGKRPDVADSSRFAGVDTTKMDSLQLAIYHHNKQIDDSIRADSVMRARSNGIDAPVIYSADDSIVYDAATGTAYLYGNSKVNYENMKLASDKVYMNLDSNTVRATGTADSTEEGGIKGKPIFTMGKDEYKTDTMAFNFKSKKGLIKGIYTEQQEGFLTGEVGKRDSTGVIYLQHGRYTTCDKPHPDFYIALSRAKVRPGKDVVFGPAYLVVADVPLPLAIPYGFFPFSKKYSSGFIMPSYGDEKDRGFYLRDGGYYFAISDKWDLKLLGEIYTKGSWGVTAASNYRKRYRYSGAFLFSYQNTKTGDKGLPDYAEQESFKLQWNHRQDPKANPYSSLAASVNFATSSYERNNLTSMYNPQTLTQSTRTSSVSWSTTFSSIGLSLSATTNLAQNMRDSSIQMTLPDLNISLSRFYPFKRKHAVGKERWYEKISMSYTGQLSNSISTKEDRFLHSNLFKDWKNAFQHSIPVQANFTLFNYINVTPSFNFTDRMYSKKILRSWDGVKQKEVNDTTYGFHNVYNWSFGMSASTKLYGFWTPSRKLFGDKIQAIRHVLTPQVSFSYSPNFGARRYGYYDSYQYTDASGNVKLVEYSPYQ
ncbi:MAG: LPS-assembly protein LptD, partial [Prevotella histicola]|nr:LPS-assembly protein LptD [Prevotella histicola]